MLVQPLAPRIPRAAPAQLVAWLPWTVVERANGCFHVSRESGGGTQREFLNNSVGRLAIFRKRATADAACAQLRDTQAGMDWWDALSGVCLASAAPLANLRTTPSLHIGQRVRHNRDHGQQRIIGVVRTLTSHTEEGTVKADIVLDEPIVIPASADGQFSETRIWSQFVPAHELTPYDERDDLIAELLEALMHCTTDEGPEQGQLDRARALIAKATRGAA